jgi:hypothetical protein
MIIACANVDLPLLRSEDLNKVAMGVAHWTAFHVFTALQTTDLVSTWSDNTINVIVIADDAHVRGRLFRLSSTGDGGTIQREQCRFLSKTAATI